MTFQDQLQSPGHRAFSLVELLVVVAVLSVLAGLVVINAPALLASGGLRSGSQLVSDSLALARNLALSKNTATYVVIRSSGDQSWQRLAVFALDPTSGQWNAASQWKSMSSGASVDPNYDPGTEQWSNSPIDIATAHAEVTPPSQAIRDGNQALIFGTDYLCIAFSPSGALLADKALALRIVRGVRTGESFAAAGGNSTPTDWVKLIIEKNTGRSKELLPNHS
jgi:prepilin-type N-terminal cleavage/methylation domain-containing protein